MRNITVTVENEVYTQARVWAAEHNTSVSNVVQYMLSTLRTDWRPKYFLRERTRSNPRPLAPLMSPVHQPPVPGCVPSPVSAPAAAAIPEATPTPPTPTDQPAAATSESV